MWAAGSTATCWATTSFGAVVTPQRSPELVAIVKNFCPQVEVLRPGATPGVRQTRRNRLLRVAPATPLQGKVAQGTTNDLARVSTVATITNKNDVL